MRELLRKLFSKQPKGGERVSVSEPPESSGLEELSGDQDGDGAGTPPAGADEQHGTVDESDADTSDEEASGKEVEKDDEMPIAPGVKKTYTTDDPAQTAPLEPLPEHMRTAPISSPRSEPPPALTAEPSIRVAQRTHVGALRKRNEDAVYTFVAQASGGFEPLPPFGLFIVADGMGGHYDGHRASKIASRAVAQHVLKTLYFPLLRGDEAIARQPIQEVMEEAVQQANRAIQLPEPDKEMGTTLTAVLILGNRLFLVHVGDSRAYLFSEEKLGQVTTDHSIVQALQDAGQLTPEQAAEHPNRNLVYRALIGDELEQVDTFTQALPDSGLILLCSDGLWGLVSESEVAAILSQESTLQEKVDQMVEEALEAGGHDNITVVLVNFDL